jgi:phosphoglucomutase
LAVTAARQGRDPGELYAKQSRELGEPLFDRVEGAAIPEQNARLAKLSPDQLHGVRLAGERIEQVVNHAPGNNAAIGGIKAIAASGWFAARPSGTEAIYKIYAESFNGKEHLQRILQEGSTEPRRRGARQPLTD